MRKLRDLCERPENRDAIVFSDTTTLDALVIFLGHSDVAVAELAAEAINFLSQSEHLRSSLAGKKGLATAVKQLMLSSEAKTRTLSIETYANIQEYLGQARASSGNLASSSQGEVCGKISDAKDYVIYVDGLQGDEDRQLVEKALLTVKGVISFTIDTFTQKVTVRTCAKPAVVIAAIEKYSCLDASLNAPNTCVNSYEHDYLSDDEEKENAAGWNSWWSSKNTKGAVVKAGGADSSTKDTFWNRVGYSLWG